MIEALGIAMVKNEADVIEAFVRHNMSLLDALVIIDNDSIDGTREILVQLQQQGLPIILFDDPIVGHFQSEIVTAVYRKVVPNFNPRFVFLLDADEFIVTPSRETLYTQLRALHPATQARYCWRTYIPAPTGPEGDPWDPLRSITHRRAYEKPRSKTIIVTKPKINKSILIQQGNHDVNVRGGQLRSVQLRDVALAHFPVRSVDQLTGKVLVGWIANLERNRHERDRGYAFQWKALYERIIQGPGLTAEDLTYEALQYENYCPGKSRWPQDVIREPVVPAYDRLTAPPSVVCTPLQKVTRTVDKILNPEADSPLRAMTTDLAQDSPRNRTTWKDPVKPPAIGNRVARKPCPDLPPFRYLAERHRPGSVLGIGTESALYLKYFASLGAGRVMGFDPIEGKSGLLHRDEYPSGGPSGLMCPADTFDLVVYLAAADHVLAQSEYALVDNIVRHADRRIVFCGTAPPQRRMPTARRQPLSQWLDLFASAGWYPCLFDSLAVRSLSTLPRLRSHLVVLTRDGHEATAAGRRLRELDRRTIPWRRTRLAMIAHPFTETERQLFPSRKTRWIRRVLRK
jgi:hypothetical protein